MSSTPTVCPSSAAAATPSRLLVGCAALMLCTSCGVVLAQSAAPGATLLEAVVVEADAEAPDEQRIAALPGGATRVAADRQPDSANFTMSRALESVPGVVVQNFFGGHDQPRVQIRGSGLQQNPVERGILILQDGLPLNRADGSYIVGLANPGQAQALEVYRGYLANRLGATVLGGAINLVSPTGLDAPGFGASLSAGSWDQFGLGARAGFSGARSDAFLQFDHVERAGYRAWNRSRRDTLGGNVAWELSEQLKTRLFAAHADLDFDVPGPLTREGLESDPRAVHGGPIFTPDGPLNPGPDVLRDRPGRRARTSLVGSRTSLDTGTDLLDVVLGYTFTNDLFRFPVASGERSTRGGDATAVLRYARRGPGPAALPRFEATLQYIEGHADRENYLNADGHRGALFGRSRLGARTLAAHAGFNLPLGTRWTLSPAIDYARARRRNADRFSAPTRPTFARHPANPDQILPAGAVPTVSTSYDRHYRGWSPSLALSFRPTAQQMLFAAWSRSFEPPTHDDLLATVNGTPWSSPGRPQPPNPGLVADAFRTPDLRAQRATTLELGWRADLDGLALDAVVFHSRVRNELLSLRDASGTSLGAVNAGRTVHSGFELAAQQRFGAHTRARFAWTAQDFHFDADPVRGDNRLAGAPRHFLTAAVEHEPGVNWALSAAARWVPTRTPVDNMNTVWADPWAVVDLRARYHAGPNVTVFTELTNVFDRRYASSTLIVDQARPDQAAFLPGDGRAAYLGLKLDY